MRSKHGMDALQPAMEAFAGHMSASANSVVPIDGKLKLPKKKKVLTPDQETEKYVVSFFKKLPSKTLPMIADMLTSPGIYCSSKLCALRLLVDEAKLACAIKDLQSVPFSSELSDGLKTQKGKTAVIISQLNAATSDDDATLAMKKDATDQAEQQMKPVLSVLKEAVRRIRVP